MKQDGFTFTELLGVVVLLGLLSIVSIPPILNQLNNSKNKLGSATLKILGIGAELYVDDHGTQYPIKNGNVYCLPLKTLTDSGYLKSPILDVSSGEELDEDINTVKMTINGFNNYSYDLVETNSCTEVRGDDANQGPTITQTSLNVTSNSIIIGYEVKENGVALDKVTCVYGENKGIYDHTDALVTDELCKINNLIGGKRYYYKVCATDIEGTISGKCITGSGEVSQIPTPSIAFNGYTRSGDPMEPVDGYVQMARATVTYQTDNVDSPIHYIMTTVQTKSNINVSKSCGDAGEPATCTDITPTSTLEANVWYQVESVDATISVDLPKNGTVVAYTYDSIGNKGYSSGTSGNINPDAFDVTIDPITTDETSEALTNCDNVGCTLDELNGLLGGN